MEFVAAPRAPKHGLGNTHHPQFGRCVRLGKAQGWSGTGGHVGGEDVVGVSSIMGPVASKIRKPSRPSMATRAKSLMLADSLAAVSSASNCRCDRPCLGDSGGHCRAPDVVRGRVFEDRVDDAGAVEAGHHRQPP